MKCRLNLLPNRTTATSSSASSSTTASTTMFPIQIFRIVLLSLMTIHCVECAFTSSSLFRKVPSSTYSLSQGQDLEIPCVTEQKQVSCYWLRNGNIIPPKPGKYNYPQSSYIGDCSLTISNLEYSKDNSKFECQVTFETAFETPLSWPHTNVVVLVKPSAPQINYDNLTNSPIADQSTDISCQSSNGNPIPRLEWFLDSTNITHYAKESVEDRTITSTLAYTFKKKDNGSRLACIAAHQTGQQRAEQILNVQYKPQVSVKQKIYTVVEGNDLEIDCQVEANPSANIFWKPAAKINEKKYKVIDNKLLLRNITHELDGNEFQCSAINVVGSSETESVKLNVLYPPRLLEASFPRKNITVGEDIRLECKFSGNPKPKIRWNFLDAISNNLYIPEPSEENPGMLIISNATYLNEGDYYCEGINYNPILNKEQIIPTSKFPVNIVGRPLFINDRKIVTGYRGLDTKLEQSFCSDPKPDKVYWFYGSNRLDVDPEAGSPNEEILDNHMDRFHIKTGRLVKINSLSPNPTCFRVALMVTNTDTEDIRDYVLAVQNRYGKSEGIVSLRVNSPLSVAAVIAFALIILVIVLAITIGIILLRRRSSPAPQSKHLDPEIDETIKCEVHVPNNDSYDGNAVAVQKTKNGH